jgi:putative ABC transport system permease protein
VVFTYQAGRPRSSDEFSFTTEEGSAVLETLWQDVQYGIRMLVKNPGFTVVSVLALALGIGANTAIFSVVNAVLLRPLPYRDPDRLVFVLRTQPPIMRGPISRPDFFEWQTQQKVFQEIAAYYTESYNLTGVEEAERIAGVRVTESFFSLFGIAPAHGRFFLPAEAQAGDNSSGGGRVAVISYGMWQREFGADPQLVGRTISLNGEAYTVVGVAPPGFGFPRRSEIWTPAILGEAKTERGSNYLLVIGRLKDGVTVSQAQAQMNQVASVLAQQYPENDTNLSVTISPLLDEQVRSIRSVLLILLGAVAFVLLIACANVANLLLARATSRQKEIAVRTALGATRSRIIRQLLTESVLLALLGGILGVLLSMWGIKLLVALAPANIPRVGEIGLDQWVLGFTLLISVLTGIIFGLAPALQVSTTNLNEVLKEGTRGAATSSPHRSLLRRSLVVVEIALSLVLLVSAGLLIESIRRLTDVNPGFNTQNLLTANVSFPRRKPSSTSNNTETAEAEQVQEASNFLKEAQNRISSLPGVQAVGAINDLPVSGQGSVNGDFNIEGRPKYRSGEAPVAEFRLITSDYFRAIGIPLLKGRNFTEADGLHAQVPIMINETLARRFFPGEDPLGKRLLVLDEKPHEIIGVVGDARQWGLEKPPDPEVYFSYAQMAFGSGTTLVARTNVEPGSLSEGLRRAVRDVNPDAPVYSIKTMTQVLADSTAQRRFNTILMTSFAAVALLMAAIGLYGVISYSVAQRVHEIGIRMALGAQFGDVMRMVLWQGFKLALAGVISGLIVSLLLTRVMATLLYGVSATDPLTFICVSVLLTGVALLACYIPARRAAKVDPMIALRYE